MGYIYAVVGVVIVGLVAVVSFQYKHIEGLNQDIATAEANLQIASDAIETQKKTLDTLKQQRFEDQFILGVVQDKLKEAQIQKDTAVANLNEYRTKLEEATLKKPEVVERATSIGIIKTGREAYEATGGEP